MRRYLLLSSVLLLISLVLGAPVVAQVAKIVIEGVPDRYKSANAGQPTTSLKTVAIGSRVVLSPLIYSGQGTKTSDTLVQVTSASWSFTLVPTGSTAALADTATALSGKVVYFTADSAGTYTVSLTATPVSGTAPAPVTINILATTYVGAGISLAEINGVPNNCGTCHQGTIATNFIDWKTTNHAQSVKRKMNEVGGHFNTSCISCHAIGYDGLPTHLNNGFDDRALVEGFPGSILPDTIGRWDSLVAHYPKTMATTGIQCENCHGPAGVHVTTGDKTKLDESLSNDVCSPCHFSTDRHSIGYQWTGSRHATSVEEGSQIQYMDRFPCAKCHTAQGYINNTMGGQAVPNNPSSGISYTNPMPVGCTTCHDPHKNNNPSMVETGSTNKGMYTYPQLRVNSIGDACMGCHQTRISSRGLHTAHQGSMLVGADATPFTLANVKAYRANANDMATNVGLWSGWEFPGYTYQNGSHSGIQERCVTCHMAKSPSYITMENSNFTVPDSLLTRVGGHTFNVKDEVMTDTDTLTYINPTGCKDCHGTVTVDFVELTQAKTKALLTTLGNLLPKRDSVNTVILFQDTVAYQNWKNSATYGFAKRQLTTAELGAAYNYQFVSNDGSYGVHNFKYSEQLLASSIDQLQLVAGAANIAQIRDVPGDNGKEVQVVWNRFPAEGASFNRVISYGIWRQDPLLPATGSSAKRVNSYAEMIKAGTVGSQFVMGTTVWTFVASVPAANLSQYSYIAPTVFDSTKVAGMRYTGFYISGHTSDPTYVYKSPIDSGYSVNNLFPLAPANVSAKSSSQGIALVWDPPTQRDNDVVQYNIYRSATPNFTPTSPFATVSLTTSYLDAGVTLGSIYYYKIAAIDNGGNVGPLSVEISLTATNVEQLAGLPKDFALQQNYPNPFNPSTQIGFSLPSQSFVRLAIYNVSGELIRTLVNTDMSAGIYRLTWNAADNDGRGVSSGVYIYRLQAGKFVTSKKMLLIR